MLVSKNFRLQEFLPKEIVGAYGLSDYTAGLIDDRLVKVVQEIRSIAGEPIKINDWHSGGWFNESGLRIPGHSHYSPTSQHTYGRAADLKFSSLSIEEAFQMIQEHKEDLMALGLTTIEDIAATPTWLHIDVRPPRLHNDIFIVNP